MKKTMKDALKNSLKNEERHVEERFIKADGIFSASIEKESKELLDTIKKPTDLVIRDTFSMPKKDADLISEVRLKCMKAGIDTTRSEVVRAGIRHLSQLQSEELCKMIEGIEKLKPGPQKQSKS
jgi:hypothetical protein